MAGMWCVDSSLKGRLNDRAEGKESAGDTHIVLLPCLPMLLVQDSQLLSFGEPPPEGSLSPEGLLSEADRT